MSFLFAGSRLQPLGASGHPPSAETSLPPPRAAGPPGTTRPGTPCECRAPRGWPAPLGGPAQREASQASALGGDQGRTDTRERTNCTEAPALLPQISGEHKVGSRPVGTEQRPPAAYLGPQVPQTTALRPSGSHTEAAAVTSPPFSGGDGPGGDKASQLASLGPKPRRQTAPLAEEAPAIWAPGGRLQAPHLSPCPTTIPATGPPPQGPCG